MNNFSIKFKRGLEHGESVSLKIWLHLGIIKKAINLSQLWIFEARMFHVINKFH